MPTKMSNARDLLLALLADLLFVERRLVAGVLRSVVSAVEDERLRSALAEHLEETRAHVERLETAFRRLDAAPSANLSRPFEAAVAQHDELAQAIVQPVLADAFHAAAALRVEHLEISGYLAAIGAARAIGRGDVADLVAETLAEEERAGRAMDEAVGRLFGAAPT